MRKMQEQLDRIARRAERRYLRGRQQASARVERIATREEIRRALAGMEAV